MSDCWAIADFHEHHHFTENGPQSASIAVWRGCDLNCGCTYQNLLKGPEHGLITEEEIRRSCVRLFATRFRLGMFDKTEYDEAPYEKVACKAHRKLALRAAEESIVLLKSDGILPLIVKGKQKLAVIGPNADSIPALYGNYNGDSGEFVTDVEGIRAAARGKRVFYAKESHLFEDKTCSALRIICLRMLLLLPRRAILLCFVSGMIAVSREKKAMPETSLPPVTAKIFFCHRAKCGYVRQYWRFVNPSFSLSTAEAG